MVNKLQAEYDAKGKTAIFLEHDIDNRSGLRNRHWWVASGKTGSQTLPFVIVDSGYKFANASGLYRKMYTDMVEPALKVPPAADLTASFERQEDSYSIHVDVTNRLPIALGYDNEARLDVLLYEDTNVIHVDHFVRHIVRSEIVDDIAPGGTASFDIQMVVDPATKTDHAKAHVLVILDYKPEGSLGFNSAQAVKAVDRLAPPTPVPPTPTVVPTAAPTEPPARRLMFLPYLLKD